MDKLGWEVTDECNVMLKCKVRGKANPEYNVQSTLAYHDLDGEHGKGLKTFPFVLPVACWTVTEPLEVNPAEATAHCMKQNMLENSLNFFLLIYQPLT